MMDLRTKYFLDGALSAKEPNYKAIDSFLFYGHPGDIYTSDKPTLRIAFYDFWPNFDIYNNIFTASLSGRFTLIYDEIAPDVLFFSVFGRQNQGINARRRVFFTGENIRPSFDFCDLAISFDYMTDARHFRMPLYVLHFYDYYKLGIVSNFCELLKPRVPPSRAAFLEKKFCAFLYSNPNCRERNLFFTELSRFRSVDAIGRVFNNTGYMVKSGWGPKIRVCSQYKFVFSFENSSYPGYTTEKIVEAFLCGSVPLYWGNERVHEEFNELGFVNVNRAACFDEVYPRILELDSNYDAYRMMVEQTPLAPAGRFHFDVHRLAEWIEEWL